MRTVDVDFTGYKFNRLTVLRLLEKRRYGGYKDWECICDCGKTTHVTTRALVSGKTKSCGCFQKEVLATIHKLPYGEASFNSLYHVYRKSGRERNIEFNLTKEDLRILTKKVCFYCGTKPSNGKLCPGGNNGEYIYNGLDRVDNSKGYIIENVVPCCKICNYAKGTMTQREFLDWLEKAYKYSIEELDE